MGQPGISYLTTLAPWNGKGGFSLDRIRKVSALLGNPQDSCASIHVAGTNGKGSVSVASAAMLAGAGARVGLISSPHLTRLNERIIIDGEVISDCYLDALALEIKSTAISADMELSFFEAMTLCGFLAFAQAKIDWAVVEVGLGGRLDATNIIERPEVAVVTTIDLDHQDILGSSLEQIAVEKAGIFKPGSKVVIGELKEAPQQVLVARAKELGLKAFVAGRDFTWNARNVNDEYVHYSSVEFGTASLYSSLRGEHQSQNISTAVTAARAAGVKTEDCIQGIASAFWPARLETASIDGRTWILDCAHNPAGVRTLGNFLRETKVSGAALVFGALATKDWRSMLSLLLPFAAEVLIVEPRGPQPVSADAVADFLSGNEVRFRVFADDYQGVRSYLRETEAAISIVAGSIYLVGDFRKRLLGDEFRYWARRSTSSTI